MLPIPASAEELIKALDKHLPHRCPDPEDSERTLWMKAGRRALVDELLSSLARDTRLQEQRNTGPKRVP